MSSRIGSERRNTYRSPPSPDQSQNMPTPGSTNTSTSYAQSDEMDITPPASASLAQHPNSSPEIAPEQQKSRAANKNNANGTDNTLNGSSANVGAAGSGPGGKVVQTAFIHKLYSMLEDTTIKHLISWSDAGDSFVMSPSPEFSKVLAQYFKHTNISSFVRQLNMYGFHKVSDVFHTGQPDSALWEFRHGQNNFKRGDIHGLREIKRRASRHALIQRPESFASPHKPSISQPGTPAEPVPELPTDARLANLEANMYDLHARLMRTEESNTLLSTKCALLNESLQKYQHWSMELTTVLTKLVPEHDSALQSQVSNIHKEMTRHSEMMHRVDEGHDPLLSARPYFSNLSLEAGSLSPRQRAQDDRRGSFQPIPAKTGFFRTPAPPHLAISPRRFGSIGTQGHSPSYRTPLPAQPPPTQHPLASVEPSPGLARRHTSADIRDSPGWPPQPGAFEGQPGSSASNWPPSPQAPVPAPGDPSIQSVLASYQLGGPRQSISGVHSRQGSPPAPESTGENGFTFKAPNYGPRLADTSTPPTRRGSIAHLLNMNEGGAPYEDDGEDGRKRKRT